MQKFLLFLILLIFPLFVWADNSGNSTGYAWFEKIGWVHFSGEDAGVDYGIKITSDQISGYVWSEKTGWISLNCLNNLSCNGQPYGVVSDGEGNLSGYAWSEKVGWINFNGVGATEYQVQVDSNGNLSGYAWSEKVGWINTDDIGDNYGVTTAAGEGYCEDCEPCNPPVLAWNLDEGFGVTAYDSSFRGNNIYNNGTVAGGAVWQSQSECVSGKCLYFDGSNDNVNRTFDADLSFKGNSFSIGGWFKTSTLATPVYLFSRYDTAGWKVWLDADGDACFGIDDDNVWSEETPDDFICTTGKNYDDNNWHYILAEKDVTGGIYLYLDGREEISDLTLTATGSISGTSPIFYAGVNSDGTTSPFRGFLDAIKIYDYARSADQIKQDYNAGLSGVSSNRGIGVSAGDSSPKWMSDGLVGYWKMDEASWNGTTNEVIDASGNNNHGKAMGGAIPGAGKFGNGGGFDGVDDYLEMSKINTNDKMTVSFWVYPRALASRCLIGESKGENFYWLLNLQTDGSIRFYVGGASTQNRETFSGALTIDSWQHVVATWEGGNTQRLWVNGIEKVGDNGSTIAPSSLNINSDDYRMLIGLYTYSTDTYLNAKMDEVRIYNRALSPDEVQQLYKYAPGPVLHLKMDEKSGTTAFDSSGNNNHGTLVNGPIWENGKINGGLRFNGIDNHVDVGTSDILYSNIFTISAWVNGESSQASYGAILGKGDSYSENGFNYGCYYRNSTSVDCFIGNGSTRQITAHSTVPQNTWYHLSFSSDGSNLYVYVNGKKVINEAINITGSLAGSGSKFLVGALEDGSSSYRFKGQVDDVKIYNYARTQEQILEDMGASAEASASQGAGALGHPILDLNFDEGQGATAFDSSGNNNHGTLVSGTTGNNTTTTAMWDKGGKEGGAVEFDGSDDYVNIGSPSSLELYSSFSVSAWFKANNLDNSGRIISKRDGAYSPIDIRIDSSSGDLRIEGWDNLNQEYDIFIPIDANKWQNVVVTFSDNLVSVFLDGKLTETDSTSTVLKNQPTYNWRLGSSYTGNYFNGLIDEVKIYNYALSESDVKTLYNDSSAMVMGNDQSRDNNGTEVTGANKDYCIPGDTAKCDKPVLELKMDEMTGTTAKDTSGNGRNGTLRNGPVWDRGKVGSSLNFNGTSQDINNISNVNIQGNFTISAWIKPETLSGERSIYYNGDIFVMQSGPALVFARGVEGCLVDGSGNNISWVWSSNSLQLEKWQHVTFISSAINNKINIYLDGKVVFDGAGKSDCASGGYSGSIGSTSSRYFDGNIDEVKIYNYARTPAQIAWDYNRGKPIGHWKMDEASGTQVDDWSGNANHGIMTNMDPIGDRVAGKNNKALDFDGVDDTVAISNFQFSSSNQFSMSQYVNFKTFATGKPIVGEWGGNQNNLLIKTDDTNSDELKICIASSLTDNCTNYATTTDLNLSANQWIHIQAVYNGAGATDADKLKLFINGSPKTLSFTGTIPGTIQSASTAGITMGGNSGAYINAILDDVKIYNYALTEEQIKLDYNGGAVNFK